MADDRAILATSIHMLASSALKKERVLVQEFSVLKSSLSDCEAVKVEN
jgi:hypothetical protein